MTPPEPGITDLPGADPSQREQPEQPQNPEPIRPPRTRRLKLLESKLHQLYMSPALIGKMALESRIVPGQPQDETLARLIGGLNNYVALVPPTVESWIELAEQNPRVLSMLEGVVDGSVIGTLIVNHLMMAVPFLPPELLERINPLAMRRNSGRNGNGRGHAAI